MKAFVLAAGFGSRLKPLTLTTPKPLITVQGKPLIFYTLALLKHLGITDVVINLHHLGEQIAERLKDGSAFGMTITYSREDPILGTGGGIAKVLPQMSSDFLVINADIITDFALAPFLKIHCDAKAMATLLLRPRPVGCDFGLVTSQDQRVTSILAEQGAFADHSQTHFTGVHLISQEQLQNFLKGRSLQPSFCIVNDVYKPCLATQEAVLAAQIHNGTWEDGGTLQALQEMETRTYHLSYAKELKDMMNVYKP